VRVAPGAGWPGDRATTATPVAADAGEVADLAAGAGTLAELDARVSVCRACPRLVGWREEVATTRRAAYAEEEYWGRPVPGFGPGPVTAEPDATAVKIAVVGLAPAAHGGNRTGRMFTGDRSGDVLYAGLYRAGLANQPTSVTADDGLALHHTRIVAAVRCAPPANKPTPAERDACSGWLDREFALLPDVRVIVVLGAFGWQSLWPVLARRGFTVPAPRPAFGHGVEVPLAGGPTLLGCYHVSQQNTFTGKLTVEMLDSVFSRAVKLAGVGA
jgi:uracil-DNA glycosylase family 4